MARKQSACIYARLDPYVHKAAKALAAAEDRSLANWISQLVTREVAKAAE